MFCTACGTKNGAGSRFCKQCGQRLEEALADSAEAVRPLSEEEQAALLERAYRLFREGELDTASTLCKESLRLRESAPAYSLLGQSYASQGQREQAIQAYERVLQLDPDSISDRVQLDALRAQEAAPVTPHIIFSGRRPSSGNLPRVLALACIGILLLLVGSALALQMRAHTPDNGRRDAVVPAPISQFVPGASAYGSVSSLASKETASQSAAATHSQPAQNTSSAPAYSLYPPIYVYQAPAPRTPPPSRGILRETHAISSAPVRLPSFRQAAPGKGRGEEDRILLPDHTDDKDHIFIQVHAANPDGSQKQASAGGTGENSGYRASVRASQSGASEDAPSEGEVHSQMAIANSLKMKGDYAGAIKVYTQALGAAGDNADASASIYEQLGLCFESRGDKTSAVTNFQKAIDAFNHMIQAGHKVEEARAGIRACNTGIKACNSDG